MGHEVTHRIQSPKSLPPVSKGHQAALEKGCPADAQGSQNVPSNVPLPELYLIPSLSFSELNLSCPSKLPIRWPLQIPAIVFVTWALITIPLP